MPFLKDLYDIIQDNEEAKAALDGALTKFLKGMGPKPLIKDQLKSQALFIKSLRNNEFPDAFASRLDYFGIVMASIAQTALLKGRGCIITNFYSPNYLLYFPNPGEELNLCNGESREKQEGRTLARLGGRNYAFHALACSDKATKRPLFEQQLKTIALEGKESEGPAFLTFVKTQGIEPITLDGIVQITNEQRFKFHSTNMLEEADLSLSFLASQASRESISSDLEELMTFGRL